VLPKWHYILSKFHVEFLNRYAKSKVQSFRTYAITLVKLLFLRILCVRVRFIVARQLTSGSANPHSLFSTLAAHTLPRFGAHALHVVCVKRLQYWTHQPPITGNPLQVLAGATHSASS